MSPVSAQSLKTAVLLIDFQNAFRTSTYHGEHRNNTLLEANIESLIDNTRRWNEDQKSGNGGEPAKSVDIIHVRHQTKDPQSPFHPSFQGPVITTNGKPVEETEQREVVRGIGVMPFAKEIDNEPIFLKEVNAAFIGTSLESHLREHRIRQLIICGISTDHCVSTSTRMAANMKVVDNIDGKNKGKVLVIGDGCATFQRGDFPADIVHNVQLASLNGEFAEVTSTQDILKHVLT